MNTLKIRRFIQSVLRRRGYALHKLNAEGSQAYEEHLRLNAASSKAHFDASQLARLDDLRARYAKVDLPVNVHSVWASRGATGTRSEVGYDGIDFDDFRGHSAFVWDYANAGFEVTRMKYFLFALHARERDAAGLVGKLEEDGAFGCVCFDFEGFGPVSRDLLDSILELNFLDEQLGLLSMETPGILDIGAGYGRLAHRALTAHPGISRYTCVDAVPESTFLCEYYLAHRGLADRAQVVPLDEIESSLEAGAYTLAVNIHSFSECTYAAVEWWLRKVAELRIPHLFIVPNDDLFLSMEKDGSRRDYTPLLKELGFKLAAQKPVFADPQVRSMMGIVDNMYLFSAQG